jgi:hypothetical protein
VHPVERPFSLDLLEPEKGVALLCGGRGSGEKHGEEEARHGDRD